MWVSATVQCSTDAFRPCSLRLPHSCEMPSCKSWRASAAVCLPFAYLTSARTPWQLRHCLVREPYQVDLTVVSPSRCHVSHRTTSASQDRDRASSRAQSTRMESCARCSILHTVSGGSTSHSHDRPRAVLGVDEESAKGRGHSRNPL